jgi:hypothetical protein
MKNNTDFKKVFKVFVIGFILISSIYVLYFYNNNNNILETLDNFTTSNKCSKCKINPSNNKCKPIYNINYNWDSRKKIINVNNVKTDYIFCEWEPNCDYDAMANNFLTQEQRLEASNMHLQNNNIVR